jgi:hypothetical protein
LQKTLYDVLGEMWRAKFVMASFAVIAALQAFLFISVSQRYVLAQMIVAPANPIGVIGLSGAAGQGMEGTIGAGMQAGDSVDAFSVVWCNL